jgi:hypothetical protein
MLNTIRRALAWWRDPERGTVARDDHEWFTRDYEEDISPAAEATDLVASMFDATAELPTPSRQAEIATQLRLDGTGEVDAIIIEQETA